MATPQLERWTDRQLLIPHRLRSRRCELGLTQKQVVTRLGRCGVRTTNRALSSIEHGAGIDVAKLPELAVALECTVTYLIGLTDDPHRWQPDRQLTVVPAAPTAKPTVSSVHVVALASVGDCSLILGDEIPDRGRDYEID
jgi:transcriptional regulator with XRE-family HTH domain